jgi:hypothetical protein
MFVTTDGTGIGNSIFDPTSIENAFLTAIPGTVVRIAKGIYNIDETLEVMNDSVIFEGGFLNLNDWAKTNLLGTTTIRRLGLNLEGNYNSAEMVQSDPMRLIGIKVIAKKGVEFHDLYIKTDNLNGNLYKGATNYGVYLSDCSNYSFVRCKIRSGKGTNGRDGADGLQGEAGADGNDGEDGHCSNVPSGGSGGPGGNGGDGGPPTGNFSSGGDGENPCYGIYGGYGATFYNYDMPGNYGRNGIDCRDGYPVINQGGDGEVPAFGNYFIPGGRGQTGDNGDQGFHGGGGGGGFGGVRVILEVIVGVAHGGAGGEGGEGGYGGLGGVGAEGGGGSFGIYINNNLINGTIKDCDISSSLGGQAGIPGDGGDGGEGGSGGAGGAQGETCPIGGGASLHGYSGGSGGEGNPGDYGGESWSGLSQAIVILGTPLIEVDSTYDLLNEPSLLVVGGLCINQEVEFYSASSGSWDFGANASPSTLNNAPIGTTSYLSAGIRDVIRVGEVTYSGFVNPICSPLFSAHVETSCNSFEWDVNGTNYTTSGVYIEEVLSDLGCKVIDTLILTIVPSVGVPVPEVANLPDVLGDCEVNTIEVPRAIDACGVVVEGTTTTIFPITTGDTTIVTWTYDDGVNTSSSQEQLFIRDQSGPRISLIDLVNSDADYEANGTVSLNDYTVASGNDRVLVICVSEKGNDPLTVSYDGIPAILANASNYGDTLINNIYYIPLGSGAQVSGEILVTTIGSNEVHLIASDYTNVDQINSIANVGDTIGNSPIMIIEATSGNTFVENFIVDANAIIGQTSNQTQIRTINGSVSDAESSYRSSYGGLNTLGYTTTGTENVGLYNVVELNFSSLHRSASCTVTPSPPANGNDECEGAIIPTTNAVFPITENSTIVWNYDDGYGNSIDVNEVITIDAIPPDISLIEYESNGAASSNNNSTQRTISNFTVPAGDDRVLVVFTTRSGEIAIPDVSYGGIQAILVDSISSPSTSSMFYIPLGSGAAITNSISAVASSDAVFHLHAASFDNVNQLNPIGNIGKDKGTAVQIEIAASNGNKIVDYFFHFHGYNPQANAGQTFTSNVNGTYDSRASYKNALDGQNVLSYIGNGSSSYYLAMELNQAPLDTLFTECEITPIPPFNANDNCAGVIVPTSNQPATINTQGTTIVTWEYDDGHGNQSFIDQAVVISDTTKPTPDDLSLLDITSECEVSSLTPPLATDNCSGVVMISHNAVLPIINQGTTVVTWSYDDGHGNIATLDQNVIINDVTNPTPGLISDVQSNCEVSTLVPPTATDNCNGVVSISHNATLPIVDQGTTIVTWTFDDGNGNVVMVPQNIIIDDTLGPMPDVAILPDVVSECEVTSLADPSATDNCSYSGVTVSTNTILPITTQGTTTIEWTYEDDHGNTTIQTQNIVINDVTGPIADSPSLNDVMAVCELNSLTEPTATDNCSSSIVSVSHDAILPITNQGTTIVTWTFDDGHGNTSLQLQNVVLNDVTDPVLDYTDLPDLEGCNLIEEPVRPTATDDCKGLMLATTATVFPITTPGLTVITWEFTDDNGNSISQDQNAMVKSVDISTSLTDQTISANQPSAFYKWIDCLNGDQVLPNETNQSFTPEQNGEYAVIVTLDGCADTSACVLINNAGINNIDAVAFSLYPNPTSTGDFRIKYAGKINRIEVIDMIGKVIPVKADQNFKTVYGSELAKGKYLVRLFTENDRVLQSQIVVMK